MSMKKTGNLRLPRLIAFLKLYWLQHSNNHLKKTVIHLWQKFYASLCCPKTQRWFLSPIWAIQTLWLSTALPLSNFHQKLERQSTRGSQGLSKNRNRCSRTKLSTIWKRYQKSFIFWSPSLSVHLQSLQTEIRCSSSLHKYLKNTRKESTISANQPSGHKCKFKTCSMLIIINRKITDQLRCRSLKIHFMPVLKTMLLKFQRSSKIFLHSGARLRYRSKRNIPSLSNSAADKLRTEFLMEPAIQIVGATQTKGRCIRKKMNMLTGSHQLRISCLKTQAAIWRTSARSSSNRKRRNDSSKWIFHRSWRKLLRMILWRQLRNPRSCIWWIRWKTKVSILISPALDMF